MKVEPRSRSFPSRIRILGQAAGLLTVESSTAQVQQRRRRSIVGEKDEAERAKPARWAGLMRGETAGELGDGVCIMVMA